MYVFKRKRKVTLPDGRTETREDATYSYRFTWEGKQIPRLTDHTDKAEAKRAGESHLFALRQGVYDLADKMRRRKAPLQLPLTDVVVAYRTAAASPRRANKKTREKNIFALRSFLRTAGAGELELIGVDVLTSALVRSFKDAVETEANAEDEARQFQLFRSGNSLLRQARSLFSKDMLEHYAGRGLCLPPEIHKFLAAPAWRGVQKTEYNPPDDSIVRRTFDRLAEIEKAALLGDVHARNIHVACWLALGFGLRAGEIKIARRNWFVSIDGEPWCAGTELAKNKKYPRVRVQLGAWARLAPFLETLIGEDYAIVGSATARTDAIFREISELMRGLGWATQHHVHELRAYAGCQLAIWSEHGIFDAQIFLRHAQIATTQKCYGHHIKRRLKEILLKLPTGPAVLPLSIVNAPQ